MGVDFPLPVKAVTIDLDGTLLDTIPDLAAAANMMLTELGRQPLDEALIRTFLHACEFFAIAPRDMLMIGDSMNDTQAARAAGCPVFCVTYGYNEGRDVRTLDTDAVVGTLDEAAGLVRKKHERS